MAIRFICPHCGHIIHVADSLDGRQGQCPNCTRFAMIQGQHIPDGSVPEVVDIATAPEGRQPPAAEPRTAVGGATRNLGRPGASSPTMGVAAPAPTRAFPGNRPPAGVAPPTGNFGPAGPGMGGGVTGGFSPGRSGTGGYANVSGSTGAPPLAEAEPDDYPVEEEAGVGVKKLVLSIVAGALAAVVIGLLVSKMIPGGETTDPPPAKDNKTGVTGGDKPAVVTRSFNGPIFKIRPAGKVAVLIWISSNGVDGQLDYIQSELQEFLTRAARPKTPVTEFSFAVPAQEGEKPLFHSSTVKKEGIDEGRRWIRDLQIPYGGQLKPAIQALLDKKPEQLFIIAEKELGDELVKELTGTLRAAKVTAYGIVFNGVAAKRDLSVLVKFDKERLREVDLGNREFGPASASDREE